MSRFNASLAHNVSTIADQVSQADLANFLLQPYRTVDITPSADRAIPCNHIPGKRKQLICRRVYYLPAGLDLTATKEMKDNALSQVVVAEDQQGYILDFSEGPSIEEVWDFDASECQVYGFPFGAFHLCLQNAASNILRARTCFSTIA